LFWKSENSIAKKIEASAHTASLETAIPSLKQKGIWTAAKLDVFQDSLLVTHHPEMGVRDSDTGELWADRKGLHWANPYDQRVWDYTIALCLELIDLGVDEIQFDYIRYPTNGWQGTGQRDRESEAIYRREVITSFLREARAALTPYRVEIAVDVYGVMAWGRLIDQAVTGQHIPSLVECVDTICPMVYPSHYGQGFAGVERPADYPAHFVAEGCRRFINLAAGHAVVRPWLQAFPFGTDRYDGQYVLEQIRGGNEVSAEGWCLWNPASRYTVAIGALAEAASQDRAPVQFGAGYNDTTRSVIMARNWPLYGVRFNLAKKILVQPQPVQ